MENNIRCVNDGFVYCLNDEVKTRINKFIEDNSNVVVTAAHLAIAGIKCDGFKEKDGIEFSICIYKRTLTQLTPKENLNETGDSYRHRRVGLDGEELDNKKKKKVVKKKEESKQVSFDNFMENNLTR